MLASSNPVIRFGYGLMIAGAVLFASIFVAMLVNGQWPAFLEPIQSRFARMADLFGWFAYVLEFAVFVVPGLLVVWLGENLLHPKKK